MPKLKNMMDSDFSFEGINIPAGGISQELTPEIHGRMMALNNGRLVDHAEPNASVVKEAVGVEQPVVVAPAVVPTKPYTCAQCNKGYDTERALKGHQLGAKHK
jgi:hypothetical protein